MIPVASVPIPPTRSIPERGFPFSSPFAYHSSATAGRRTTTQCVGMAQAGFPISDMFSVSRVFFSFDPKKKFHSPAALHHPRADRFTWFSGCTEEGG